MTKNWEKNRIRFLAEPPSQAARLARKLAKNCSLEELSEVKKVITSILETRLRRENLVKE